MNQSGSKYLRTIRCTVDGAIDVYAVLDAFAVTCPARAHAIKKLLCSGLRGKGSEMQDLTEARDAVDRAIEMQAARQAPEFRGRHDHAAKARNVCASFDRSISVSRSSLGECDWVSRHLVDVRVPSWVMHKFSRPRMPEDRPDCGAWEKAK